MTWFFDDLDAVEKLRAEALGWLYPQPTPFRKFSRAKGPGGGVDCVGLCEALMIAAGVVRADEFLFPRGDADYQSANTARKIMRYLTGRADDPQSKRLAEIFVKIPIARALRMHHDQRQKVGKYFRKPGPAVNIPASLFMPGDLLVLRDGGLFHMPVILEGRHFVSAIPEFAVREGNVHDGTYSLFIAGLFRARHSSLVTRH